jgi:chromosome segregation ATPase
MKGLFLQPPAQPPQTLESVLGKISQYSLANQPGTTSYELKTAGESIDQLEKRIEAVEKERAGKAPDSETNAREIKYVDESLMKALLKLDNIQTSDPDYRAQRKQLVNRVNALHKRCDNLQKTITHSQS